MAWLPESAAGLPGPALSLPSSTEAVIYCRVSSDRQAKEGDGARSQEQRCRAYVQSLGYRLLGTFRDEGVSGAVVARPGMEALLQFLRTRPGETVVVIDDISRIARDVTAHFQLRAALKAAGGRLESPSFTFGDGAADELLETIMAATAQYGRTGNREQVLNRMRARLEAGYWTFPAPVGYRYERHPLHKKVLVPTSEARAFLVPALEGFATGRFVSQRDVALFLAAQGFFGASASPTPGALSPTAVTVLEKRVGRVLDPIMLPLYAGLLEYPAWSVGRRPAQHEALISPAILARLEDRLEGRARALSLGAQGVARQDAEPQLILRNFIRCSGCGRPLTGSLAKGRYPRYNCYCAACPRYGDSYSARRLVHPAFEDLLGALAPTPEFVDTVEMLAPLLWKQQSGERAARSARLEQEREQAEAQMARLVRRLATVPDAIVPAVEQEIAALQATVRQLERDLARAQEAGMDYEAIWKRVNTAYRDPLGSWKNGSDSQKRTVHRMVFTVPPTFDRERGFNTYDLSLPYQVSATFGRGDGGMVEVAEILSHGFWTIIEKWGTWMF